MRTNGFQALLPVIIVIPRCAAFGHSLAGSSACFVIECVWWLNSLSPGFMCTESIAAIHNSCMITMAPENVNYLKYVLTLWSLVCVKFIKQYNNYRIISSIWHIYQLYWLPIPDQHIYYMCLCYRLLSTSTPMFCIACFHQILLWISCRWSVI